MQKQESETLDCGTCMCRECKHNMAFTCTRECQEHCVDCVEAGYAVHDIFCTGFEPLNKDSYELKDGLWTKRNGGSVNDG